MTPEEQEIAEFCRGIYTRYGSFDPDQLEAIDEPDCTIWDLFEPRLIRGSAERAAFRREDMAASKGRGPLSITVHEPVVTIDGDIAIARYYLDYAFAEPNPLAGQVRVTTVLRRGGDGWRRIHHHEGVVPSGRPAVT